MGRTAVVTGAASGIGRALARRWASSGMNVVMADVNDDALAVAAGEVEALGAQVLTVRTDVAQLSDVENLRDRAIERFGPVSLLCNNAGVGGRPALIEHIGEAIWDWVLGVNVFGLVNGFRAFVPHLAEQREAHIVNTASAAGFVSPGAFLAPYNVSKHAAVAVSEAMYAELGITHPNIGISVLCPGLIATNIGNFDELPVRYQSAYLAEASEAERKHAALVTRLVATGRDPANVADIVHEGVLAGQFYLFVDDSFDAAIQRRQRDINTRTNP